MLHTASDCGLFSSSLPLQSHSFFPALLLPTHSLLKKLPTRRTSVKDFYLLLLFLFLNFILSPKDKKYMNIIWLFSTQKFEVRFNNILERNTQSLNIFDRLGTWKTSKSLAVASMRRCAIGSEFTRPQNEHVTHSLAGKWGSSLHSLYHWPWSETRSCLFHKKKQNGRLTLPQ